MRRQYYPALVLFLLPALGFAATAPNPAPQAALAESLKPADAVTPEPTPSPSVKPPPVISASDYKKFRDPFKEPVYVETAETRGELERHAVTDFKITGIITGPVRMRAMILAPDGKTHYVAEKMKIGLRDGVIVKITTKTIVVREKVVNPLGDVELFDTEIGIDQNAGANNAL